MVVRIRLSRFGRRRQPIYNIVISQARTARDSKPMEVVGTYDPLPKTPRASAGNPLSRNPFASTSTTQPSFPSRSLSATGTITPTSSSEAIVGTDDAEENGAAVKRFKDVQLDQARVRYWLGVGAQPSEAVEKILVMVGLLVPRPGKLNREEV